MEIATVRRVNDEVVYHVLTKGELEALLKRAESVLKEDEKKDDKDKPASGDI